MEPILAEDSGHKTLVPSLENILKDLDETATHHDYLLALIIVLLGESGFYPPSTDKSQLPKLKFLRIPKDWKSAETRQYTMYFQYHCNLQFSVKCKLMAYCCGDLLVVNFFPIMGGKKIYTICLQTLRYINLFSSDLRGRYMRLKSVSHSFKDKVATPVRGDILRTFQLMGPSLVSIPAELKLKISNMLDETSLARLAQCSTEFYRLCKPEIVADRQNQTRAAEVKHMMKRHNLLCDHYDLSGMCASQSRIIKRIRLNLRDLLPDPLVGMIASPENTFS